jgi:hypothetical protein
MPKNSTKSIMLKWPRKFGTHLERLMRGLMKLEKEDGFVARRVVALCHA